MVDHKCEDYTCDKFKCKKCSVTFCEGCAQDYDICYEMCIACEYKSSLLNEPNSHIIGSELFKKYKYYPVRHLIAWHAKDLKELEKIKDELNNANEALQKANATIEELELRPPGVGGRLFLEGQARAISNGMRP